MNWSRKRIRGLRRHFRNLQQRAIKPSELRLVDLEWLARFQQTYHNVLTAPWDGCEEVPQKQEFRALWVARFLQIFPHWHAQLKRRYPTFYLAIWLYEPTDEAFCQSRIVVAVNERRLPTRTSSRRHKTCLYPWNTWPCLGWKHSTGKPILKYSAIRPKSLPRQALAWQISPIGWEKRIRGNRASLCRLAGYGSAKHVTSSK